MMCFRIAGRCIADPPPTDWRDRLGARLGAKPRRIGTWAELGLYGAMECLADAGETTLSAQASLILSSQHGPVTGLRSAAEQASEDLPMPFTFLQTQPSQLLAMIAAQLSWRGDARFITHEDPQGLLRLAAVQGNQAGLLLGWVEEVGLGRSVWLRLKPDAGPAQKSKEVNSFWRDLAYAKHLFVFPEKITVVLDLHGFAVRSA